MLKGRRRKTTCFHLLLATVVLTAVLILGTHLRFILHSLGPTHSAHISQQGAHVREGVDVAPHINLNVWWYAPFFSGSGYGSEAAAFVLSLVEYKFISQERMWITHHGDEESNHVLKSMDPAMLRSLRALESNADDYSPVRKAIIVCHSFPALWMDPDGTGSSITCPPANAWDDFTMEEDGKVRAKDLTWWYLIGRTMFESDQIPEAILRRMETMNEIWVPTHFQKEVFANSGIPPSKIFVVPEAVNTAFFDPEIHSPANLPLSPQFNLSDHPLPPRFRAAPHARSRSTLQSVTHAASLPITTLPSLSAHSSLPSLINLNPFSLPSLPSLPSLSSLPSSFPSLPSDPSAARFSTLFKLAHQQTPRPLPLPFPPTSQLPSTIISHRKTLIDPLPDIPPVPPLPQRPLPLPATPSDTPSTNQPLHHLSGPTTQNEGKANSTPNPAQNPTQSHASTSAAPPRYRFLSIFKWEMRKGWDLLLSAFLNEFSASDAVELHILTRPMADSDRPVDRDVARWIQHHYPDRDTSTLPALYLHLGYVDDATLAGTYRACDAFVLPSRGEGWGRPHVEAMSMGLPVLSTNWSGPTEFIDDTVGYPLKVESLVEAGLGFEGKWAQPSVAHLQQLMRHVSTHREEGIAKGKLARQRMVQEYAPKVVARKLAKELARVEQVVRNRNWPWRVE